MAHALGIPVEEIPVEEQLVVQGFEKELDGFGLRWPSVAALRPEGLDYVEWVQDGEVIDTVYDEPYSLNFRTTFVKAGIPETTAPAGLIARVHTAGGEVLELPAKR
jgi:hypothetical protein